MSLADVKGQEAFPQPGGQVACDARDITASVLARYPGSRNDMLIFQTLVLSFQPCRLSGQALVSGHSQEP